MGVVLGCSNYKSVASVGCVIEKRVLLAALVAPTFFSLLLKYMR